MKDINQTRTFSLLSAFPLIFLSLLVFLSECTSAFAITTDATPVIDGTAVGRVTPGGTSTPGGNTFTRTATPTAVFSPTPGSGNGTPTPSPTPVMTFAGTPTPTSTETPGGVRTATATPTAEAESTRCLSTRVQNIVEKDMPPGDYVKQLIESPQSGAVTVTTVPATFQFYVNMPISHEHPYVLGPDGDFNGIADICRLRDPVTKQEYEVVTIKTSWKENSGGAYHIQFGFRPYVVGAGAMYEGLTVNTLFGVDGNFIDSPEDDAKCLGTSSEDQPKEERIFGQVVFTPEYYRETKDEAVANMVSYLSDIRFPPPIKYVKTVDEIVDGIKKVYTTFKEPIDVVLASHGNVDVWVMAKKKEGPDDYLTAEDKRIKLLETLRGKVKSLHFYSCCTGKDFALGIRENLLDEVADALFDKDSSVKVSVVGFKHMLYSFKRFGKFRLAYSKGDRPFRAKREP